MSCIITYKGNQYSEQEFKKYFNSNTSEFIKEIANSKNVIDSFKNKIDAINYVFQQAPELESIGTKTQYLKYLSTIFPNSKVRDIVYHRTNSDWFKTQLFSKNVKPVTGIGEDNKIPESQGAIYFYYKDKEGASNLTGKYIFPVILNIKTLGEYTGKGRIFNTASNKKILDDLENEIIKLENLVNESQDLVLRKEKREQANKLLDVYNTLYDNNKIKQIAQLEEGQGLTYIKKWDFSYIDGITDYRWLLIPNPEQIHILGSKQDIEGFKEFVKEQPQLKDIVQITEDNKVSVDVLRNDNTNQDIKYQLSKEQSEGIIASEKTIRDLVARMSDRIGIPFRIISDRTQQFKGKIENNVAYVNLAYATLDTPIHEILGHPIIRAIKNNKTTLLSFNDWYRNKYGQDKSNWDSRLQEYEDYKNNQKLSNQLYQNLLKELETGKGKEVLDRIKRDYKKEAYDYMDYVTILDEETFNNQYKEYYKNYKDYVDTWTERNKEQQEKADKYNSNDANFQEEAIVELLGLMTAEKLDAVKDGKLISLLKRLLKEIKAFMKSLIGQKEVEIDKLPDNMTINDLSDLLAYSNSKLILPGYEVEYTTPDNMKFKTYQEAINHISELAKNVKDVDLSNLTIKTEDDNYSYYYMDKWFDTLEEAEQYKKYLNLDTLDTIEKKKTHTGIKEFLVKNKEYEQSKEIIEEWKKVNDIVYNPEEIYSRGQEFLSVVGAYSNFDINLMMQNLLSHIEDNEKAGGKFAISAYTKPIDRQIGHLEGGGGKIKFKLYPQSNDILWAANTDVYSGSVWDASEKVNKDKKSELLGVSYTKYPSLSNVNAVQPNLASIVDNLAHHHNELAIALNFSNFELEVDEDVSYTTKKIIENVNKVLQQKRLEEVNSIINKLEKEC